jgi:hypothetical protein
LANWEYARLTGKAIEVFVDKVTAFLDSEDFDVIESGKVALEDEFLTDECPSAANAL